ncbi:beta-propeller fold lactonase family protein [Variovorax sp. J2P1-59]|uniref:lactonase family protein n=1 Tax=Variovorax flavidus TaxID=3053501 RepID=UPI002575277B|nr:beta-propeller fold lactonase family protein [Variovorax sp. J2P1-59]MDM0078740.1 beta-propeller fold lactonase family protein [Variovorax sp. J2P1-59]
MNFLHERRTHACTFGAGASQATTQTTAKLFIAARDISSSSTRGVAPAALLRVKAGRCLSALAAFSLAVSLTACGGGSLEPAATAPHTIGGKVAGLEGSGLVLQNNAGDDLPVGSTHVVAKSGPASYTFAFAGKVEEGKPYAVTVKTQPTNPTQTCSVSNGAGTVGQADVTDVSLVCSTQSFAVGGLVSGLQGTVVLRNNAGDDLSVSADGSFVFGSQVASGAGYQVTVAAQPPNQTCSVNQGAGTINGAAVSNVAVVCATTAYTVHGTLSGYQGSDPLVLHNNSGDPISLQANGVFQFPVPVAVGAGYAVTVYTQPGTPLQTCSVVNGTGVMGNQNVSNVAVICSSSALTIGGTISGLQGSGFTLQNNGGDNLSVTYNGSFTFPAGVVSGATYNVTVSAAPSMPAQTCTVTNGTGTAGLSNVTNVSVNCSADFAMSMYLASAAGASNPGLLGFENGPSGYPDPIHSSSPTSFTTSSGSTSLVLNAATGTVYEAVDGAVKSYTINSGSPGNLTLTSTANFSFPGSDGNVLALAPSGRKLFAVSKAGNRLSSFDLNVDGTLAGDSSDHWTFSLMSPVDLVVDPSGKFLYVANEGSNDISRFPIDSFTGNATSPTSVPGIGGPLKSLAIDPTGRFLYAADPVFGEIYLYAIGQSDGSLTQVGGMSVANVSQVKMDPYGTFLVALSGAAPAGFTLVRLNKASGLSVSFSSVLTGGTQLTAAAIDATGSKLVVADDDTVRSYSVTPTNILMGSSMPVFTSVGSRSAIVLAR